MSAIAFNRSPSSSESKDELKLKTVTFEVRLFPDNNADDRTVKHSMLKFSGTSGDPEDYLEFRRDLDDLFNCLNVKGPWAPVGTCSNSLFSTCNSILILFILLTVFSPLS